MVFDKAKKAVEAKEAEIKGQKWLSEVKQQDGQWKDLQDWKDTYEPQKEKKEKTEAQKKMAAKAVDAAFDKMQEGLSKAIFQIMMEAASTLLGTTNKLIVASGKDAKQLPTILTSTNAIILSYRFETPKKINKFGYIRKTACLDLTKTLHFLLPERGAAQVSEDIRTVLAQHKEATRADVLQKVNSLLGNVSDAMDEKGQAVERAVKSASNTIGADKVTAATTKVSEATGMTPESLKAQKNDIVAQFGSLFQGILVSHMEQIDALLHDVIDKVIAAMEIAIQMNNKLASAKAKTPEELQDVMVEIIDKQYKLAQKRLNGEIQKVINMIKALVQNAMIDMDAE
ncbi:expressed unknown protein [Seminavis robusta]|uniref:Uncharacterized protein n=1 Tax=Seminavis robusta TaxID=568900 RepID=A0A9N8DPF4_9STRA|nr:expressed unknown protein [Seminavis robusta]|eukprot:Sro276_g106040.1 n/a (342) ;mRNA; f:50888-51913